MNRSRVLIVDDEVGFTRLLRLNLAATGRYLVREENDGLTAIKAVHEFHPDVILLDVMMPGLDGGELAAHLQRYEETRRIPIVFVTAAVSPGEVTASHGLRGGVPFVAKPVELPELLRCIEHALTGAAPPLTAGLPIGEARTMAAPAAS